MKDRNRDAQREGERQKQRQDKILRNGREQRDTNKA